MPTSEFVVLLARQRSGTNPLRSVLGTHPDIMCFPEVFTDHPTTDWELEVATNYASFLAQRAGGDTRSLLVAADHRAAFRDFLEYLRCFSDKRVLLVDVKYNSTHHVAKYWRFISEQPFLFTLLKEEGIRVLNLTRRNYLRYWLSEVKAHKTQRWEAFDERVVGDRRWFQNKYADRASVSDLVVHLDVEETLEKLALCKAEDEIVRASFAGYGPYLELAYEELFGTIGAPMAEDALHSITDWLGLEAAFGERRPEYRKQSGLPLAETIENFPEIAAALRGTPFEYCLEDERLYAHAA